MLTTWMISCNPAFWIYHIVEVALKTLALYTFLTATLGVALDLTGIPKIYTRISPHHPHLTTTHSQAQRWVRLMAWTITPRGVNGHRSYPGTLGGP